MATITLIRHGRSGHVHSGWTDHAGFRRWREAYEAAGIHEDEIPPAGLSAGGVLASSTARRAMESAKLLAPGREAIASPLLCELELPALALPIRLPLFGWALAVGLRWLLHAARGLPRISADEERRVRDAAEWLAQLAREHGSVAAVTHASFRAFLGRELARAGWRRHELPRRKSDHWSAWSFSKP